jgi:hypothetical protein
VVAAKRVGVARRLFLTKFLLFILVSFFYNVCMYCDMR